MWKPVFSGILCSDRVQQLFEVSQRDGAIVLVAFQAQHSGSSAVHQFTEKTEVEKFCHQVLGAACADAECFENCRGEASTGHDCRFLITRVHEDVLHFLVNYLWHQAYPTDCHSYS